MLSHNDIMEELSLVYVRAVAARAGFAVEEVRRDRDSIDLHVLASGVLGGGSLHSPALAVQLKSTAFDLPERCTEFPYDLKVRNYNHLAQHPTMIPRVLVLLVLPEDEGKVVELSGAPNAAGQLDGDVILQVQADDQLLKVRVALAASDYAAAGAAHFAQQYVSVHGELHRGRRTHGLKNPTGFTVLGP